jgi:hypothetical protein
MIDDEVLRNEAKAALALRVCRSDASRQKSIRVSPSVNIARKRRSIDRASEHLARRCRQQAPYALTRAWKCGSYYLIRNPIIYFRA